MKSRPGAFLSDLMEEAPATKSVKFSPLTITRTLLFCALATDNDSSPVLEKILLYFCEASACLLRMLEQHNQQHIQ